MNKNDNIIMIAVIALVAIFLPLLSAAATVEPPSADINGEGVTIGVGGSSSISDSVVFAFAESS